LNQKHQQMNTLQNITMTDVTKKYLHCVNGEYFTCIVKYSTCIMEEIIMKS